MLEKKEVIVGQHISLLVRGVKYTGIKTYKHERQRDRQAER